MCNCQNEMVAFVYEIFLSFLQTGILSKSYKYRLSSGGAARIVHNLICVAFFFCFVSRKEGSVSTFAFDFSLNFHGL